MNQLEFVFEELSDIQGEVSTINSFSMLDINRSYGDSTSACLNVSLNNNDSEISEFYMSKDIEFAISSNSIIGTDDRTQVLQTRNWPYRGIVKMYMTFDNVLNQRDEI